MTTTEICLFTHATVRNFLPQGLGVLYLPPGGVDSREVIADLKPYLRKNDLDGLRVAEELKTEGPLTETTENSNYTILLKGGRNNIDTDTYVLFNTLTQLKQPRRDKPALRVMGYDTMESKYSTVIEKFYNEVGFAIMSTRASGDLTLAVARPNMSILAKVLDMVDWHFSLTKEDDTLLFQGIKPYTPLYAVECDVSEGYPRAKLVIMI